MHLAEDNDEDSLEDLEKEPSVLLEQEAQFQPEWEGDSSGISISSMVDKKNAFNREEVDNRPKLMMTGKSKLTNTQMGVQYREDDFSWKPRNSTYYNTVDENTCDAQSPSPDEAPIPDFETIIKRAVQEEEKKELIKKEGKFLDFMKNKKQTSNSVSKTDRTKDKKGFFESALACEAIVEEDELPNLVESSTVDLVLHGKTTGSFRAEGNNEKRNRLKRKTPNRNQEKISTPDKIRKVEKDDEDQREQFQSLLKSEEESIKTESEGRDTEDEGKSRRKLPTLSSNNDNKENMSSSSKIEMMKPVSRAMSKKKLFGNLERCAANLPSFEEESDDEQRGSNDASTESCENLERSSRKKTTEMQLSEKVSTTMRAKNDESTESYEDLEQNIDKKTTIVQNLEKISISLRASNDESTESYEDLEQNVGKKTREKLSPTVDEDASSGIGDVDKTTGFRNNRGSSGKTDDDMLNIVDEAINVVKKSTKKTRTKKKKAKLPVLLNTGAELIGLKDTTERSSETLEEMERSNSRSEEDIENTEINLGEVGRTRSREKHVMAAAAEEEYSVQTPDKQETETDALKSRTEKQENTEMNEIEVKRQDVDLLKEKRENFKDSDNGKFQDRKGEVQGSKEYKSPKHQLKSPSSGKKFGKKRKDKMNELMNRDWKESLASFKKGKQKRKEGQMADQGKTLTIGQEIKLAAKSMKKRVKDLNSSDSIPSGSSSDELFKADLDQEESESEKPTRVLRKRKAPVNVKKMTNSDDSSSETSSEDDKVKKSTRKKKNSEFRKICMSPVVKITKMVSEPSLSSSEVSLPPMEEENGNQEPKKSSGEAEELLQNRKSQNCDQSFGGNSTSGTEEYDPKPPDPVQKSPEKHLLLPPGRLLRKRKSPRSNMSIDRDETTSEDPDLSKVKSSLMSPDPVQKSPVKPLLLSPGSLLRKSKSPRSDMTTDRDEATSEELDLPHVKPQLKPTDPVQKSPRRLLRKRKSPGLDMSTDRDEKTPQETDPSQVKPQLKSQDLVQKSPETPLLPSPERLLRKRKSPRSDMSTDRDETTSEEIDPSQFKPSLNSPARSLKRPKPSQEKAGPGTQSTSDAEKYEPPARELNEESDREKIFRKISFRSPRKTSKKRNSPRCSKKSKSSSSSSERYDQARGFDESQSVDTSTDDTLNTTSSGSLVKVDGPHDRRLSLRKKKQPVPIVIGDSTTTTSEDVTSVTSLNQSADYTGAESSIHMSTSKDSDPDAS